MTRLKHRNRRSCSGLMLLLFGGLSSVACDDSDAKGGDASAEDAATSDEDGGGDEDYDAASEEDAAVEDAGHDAGHSEDASAEDAASATDAGGGGSDAAADAGAAPTCAEYCTTLQANCTGALAQYASMASCMAVCTSFPLGSVGQTSGNTLGCRLYHAGAAAGSGATTHCNHAGITGGDKNPMDTTDGVCGEGCDAFCNEALIACTATTTPGGTAPFASKQACIDQCRMFPASTDSFSAGATGDNFHCRAYHLTAASTGPDPHCGHISKTSPTCK